MRILKDVKKQHIAVITTNLTAVAISVFFMSAYREKGVSPFPAIAAVLVALISFLIFSYLVLAPLKGMRPLPPTGIVAANVIFALFVGIYFISRIGMEGIAFTVFVSLLLSIIEHLLYESVRN